MNKIEAKAVIGTNSWGSKAYGKAVRGSYVEDDIIKDAMREAEKCGLMIYDHARDYGFGKGNIKFGIIGASTTAMMALAAASYIPDLTLTVALSPSDFIMEGFYRDGLDGAKERPGNHESTLSYKGKRLPYLPFAYRHPEYWQKLSEEAKRRGDIAAARDMFDLSEQKCPLTEDITIKVERIKGKLALVGAQDDSLWDTCRYIDRMIERLKVTPHACRVAKMTYQYGSHFVFPQSMLEIVLPVGSSFLLRFAFRTLKDHPKECKQTRIDIDRRLRRIIQHW